MKNFRIKNIVLGIVIGSVGITSVFAADGIKHAAFSNTGVTLNGVLVPLGNSLVSIQKNGEKDASLYMPARELLEYLGYNVEFESKTNMIKLISPKQDNDKSNSSSISSNYELPEHFNSGGVAKTIQNKNTYTYEGIIGVAQYQSGEAFTANIDEQLTFEINALEYTSGESMEEDESILRVVLETNSGFTEFSFVPITPNGLSATFPATHTGKHNITILNETNKEVKYNFTLTVK